MDMGLSKKVCKGNWLSGHVTEIKLKAFLGRVTEINLIMKINVYGFGYQAFQKKIECPKKCLLGHVTEIKLIALLGHVTEINLIIKINV